MLGGGEVAVRVRLGAAIRVGVGVGVGAESCSAEVAVGKDFARRGRASWIRRVDVSVRENKRVSERSRGRSTKKKNVAHCPKVPKLVAVNLFASHIGAPTPLPAPAFGGVKSCPKESCAS